MPYWVALITAVVGAGLSAGVAEASAPDYPNPASSSRKVSIAGLRALPGQRMVEQAARLGRRVDYPTGKVKPKYETRSVTIREARDQGLINEQKFQSMARNGQKLHVYKVPVPGGGTAETREADFTGYGDADVQGKLAKAMAGIQLELQQKYGTQFVDEARKQQEQADPEGTAARGLLADKINEMEQARRTRTRPVAEAVDTQILDELGRGRGVDPETGALAERVLARRGGTTLTGGDVTAEMERGPAGDERMRARLQKGLSYYGSGASPTDAAYREEQQSMANMANFLAGRTPQSQFASLSGGQQGASPMPQGPALPNVTANGQQNAQQAGVQNYAQGVRAAANQVSPWFVGLNAVVQGIQAQQAARKPA